MATLYITELTSQGVDNGAHIVPAAVVPAKANQAISISGVSAQSATLNNATTIVRLQTDVACWVLVGTNPTATTSAMPLAANVKEYFCIPENSDLKIAAITA